MTSADARRPKRGAQRNEDVGEPLRVVALAHERSRRRLYVEHDRGRAAGDLLRHDRRGDEADARTLPGAVAQIVEPFVGRHEAFALRRDRAADAIDLRAKSAGLRSVRTPGIDSSLSSVPPVWPSARPESFATRTPHAATSGTTHERNGIADAAGGITSRKKSRASIASRSGPMAGASG